MKSVLILTEYKVDNKHMVVTRKINSAPVTSFRRKWGIWKFVTRNTEKCPLSVLTGVRIERVKFKENTWAFRRDKRNYPLSTSVRRAGFHCIVHSKYFAVSDQPVPGPNIVRKADREKVYENRVGLRVEAWNNSSFQSITESFIYKYMTLAIVYFKDCIFSDSSEPSKMRWREEDVQNVFLCGIYQVWLIPDHQCTLLLMTPTWSSIAEPALHLSSVSSWCLKIIVPQYRGDWNNLNNDCTVTRLLKKVQIQSD